jgi:hypothetical protein
VTESDVSDPAASFSNPALGILDIVVTVIRTVGTAPAKVAAATFILREYLLASIAHEIMIVETLAANPIVMHHVELDVIIS